MSRGNDQHFTGSVYIFHSFDVGDDIKLDQIRARHLLQTRRVSLSRYFKNYHIPLVVEPPTSGSEGARANLAKVHSFGVISLRYKIPFESTLSELREKITELDTQYESIALRDAKEIYGRIAAVIKQPRFFHLRKSYLLIQVDPRPELPDAVQFKEQYGTMIASMVRFETESLSQDQMDEILESAIGYYRGDLIIVDREAAFIYDDEYEDILDFLEFGSLQQLELQYFDRVLDQRLNTVYEQEVKRLPLTAYLPFWGTVISDPVEELGKLRVDISVITERLESSIKLVGEPYYVELYNVIIEKFDLKKWKESVANKLSIIHDISAVYESKVETMRQDLFSILIIILIFMEFLVGILNYIRG